MTGRTLWPRQSATRRQQRGADVSYRPPRPLSLPYGRRTVGQRLPALKPKSASSANEERRPSKPGDSRVDRRMRILFCDGQQPGSLALQYRAPGAARGAVDQPRRLKLLAQLQPLTAGGGVRLGGRQDSAPDAWRRPEPERAID